TCTPPTKSCTCQPSTKASKLTSASFTAWPALCNGRVRRNGDGAKLAPCTLRRTRRRILPRLCAKMPSMIDPIYLDFAATTPVDARVAAVMQPFFAAEFGTPSWVHRGGQEAERARERARRDVAAVLNCRPTEIVFTSGGSEADNLALRGAAL